MKKGPKKFAAKCRNERYYSAIKYMSHTLKGAERTRFIIRICKYNIYLGCLCYRTCEEDEKVKKHINYALNNYFKPKNVSIIDKKTGYVIRTQKKITSFDKGQYLLACSVTGNFDKIKKYVIKNFVDKSVLYNLEKNLDASQMVELLYTLYLSKCNSDKLRGIGSTKNLLDYKNDLRVKRMLKGLWYKDKDAFIQLSYDTGWLKELSKHTKKGKYIYVDCLQDTVKIMTSINILIDALSDIENGISGYDVFYNIFKRYRGKNKEYILMLLYYKLQEGGKFTNLDYQLMGSCQDVRERIKNYYIKFFMIIRTNGGKKYNNIDYIEFLYACRNFVPDIKQTKKSGRCANFERIIKESNKIDLRKIISIYFFEMSQYENLDNIFHILMSYHGIEKEQIILLLNKFPLWVSKEDNGHDYRFDSIRTKNNLSYLGFKEDKNVLCTVIDYENDKEIFSVKPLEGNFTLNAI